MESSQAEPELRLRLSHPDRGTPCCDRLVVSTQTSCCAGLAQSEFHFVSNLISQEAEPRYRFLVNILDPATPESDSRQALYATPLKLGANEHVSPSSQV